MAPQIERGLMRVRDRFDRSGGRHEAAEDYTPRSIDPSISPVAERQRHVGIRVQPSNRLYRSMGGGKARVPEIAEADWVSLSSI